MNHRNRSARTPLDYYQGNIPGKKIKRRYKGGYVNHVALKAHNKLIAFRDQYRGKSVDEIIKRLKKLSMLKLYNSGSYKKRRKKKHPCDTICFVCRHNRAIYHHHIIPLRNGGTNTNLNLIPICPECHKLIHPYMHKELVEQYHINSIDKDLTVAYNSTVH